MDEVSGCSATTSGDGTALRHPFKPAWPHGPEISSKPLRKVISRSAVVCNGRFRTYKHPSAPVAVIDGDSDNELLFFRLAEMDPNVEVIVVQPTRLTPHIDGKGFVHIPDVALISAGRAQLHEIKSDRALSNPDVKARLTASGEYVEAWPDWSYLVVSAHSMYNHPCLAAVNDLWRCHRRIWTDLQRRAVLDLLARDEMIIADIASALASVMGNAAPTQKQVLSLAAGCEIFIDLNEPIGKESRVRYPDRQALPPTLLPSVRPGELLA